MGPVVAGALRLARQTNRDRSLKLSSATTVSTRFKDAGSLQPAIAQDAMVMDGNFVSDARRREELELIKAFLGITDPGRRQRILELAEQLADEAASDAAELAFISTDALAGEAPGDVPGRTE